MNFPWHCIFLNNTFLDYIPGNDLCQRDPVHLLVLQDVFGVDEIQDSQQECCNQCHSEKCKFNCEIIGMFVLLKYYLIFWYILLFLENGYSSKNLCKAPKEFILTLADKSNMTRLHEDNHECKKSCTNATCQENYLIIEGNDLFSFIYSLIIYKLWN